jgi:hypothetical protein
MLDRLISVLVSISLAFLVWLYARSRDQETLDNIPIPVRVSLPERDAGQYLLDVNGPGYVPASFTGPPSRIHELREMLQRGELAIQVTATVPPDWHGEGRILDTVRVVTADLHPPGGVRGQIAEGMNRVPVTLRRIVERRLPVRVDHGLHDRLLQCQTEPDTVLVRGPQDVLDRTSAISTRPFIPPAGKPGPDPLRGSELREIAVQGPVQLVTEIDGRPVQTTPDSVAVRLTLRPIRKVYEVQASVHFLCPANYTLQPQWTRTDDRANRIPLRIIGPPVAELPAITCYVDLTRPAFQAERDLTQVLYADEPIRVQLPPDFTLAQDPPPASPFWLVPLAPEPGRLPFLGGISNP